MKVLVRYSEGTDVSKIKNIGSNTSKHIVVLDSNKYLNQAYDSNPSQSKSQLYKSAIQLIMNELKSIENVIVLSIFDIPRIPLKIYVKIAKDALQYVYQCAVKSEVSKYNQINNTDPSVAQIIEDGLLSIYLLAKYEIGKIGLIHYTLTDYKKDYNADIKYAKSKKYIILLIDDAIDYILEQI